MTSIGFHVPMGREARQPWVRAALFTTALAFSLALHGLLLAEFPAFSLRKPVDWTKQVKPRPMVMREVRPLPDRPQ